MTFKPKRKDGSVRMIEQLRAEFPNESPWVYVRGKGPHWKSSVSGRVVPDVRKVKQTVTFGGVILGASQSIDNNKGTAVAAWLSQEFGDGLVVEEIVPFKISIEETLGDVIKGSDE